MRKLIALSVTLAAFGCSGSPGGNQSSSTTSESSSSVGSTASSSEGSSSNSTTSAVSSERSNSSNASSGGTSSSSNDCGTDTCGSCPCGDVANDQCVNGGWQCACAFATGSSSCSSFNDSSSSGGTSSTSSSCGIDTCSACPPGCLNADTCTARGWSCGCACTANSSSSSSGNSSSGNSSSGGSSTTVACNLDGGTPTLIGTWVGNASFGETFGKVGGGGGGPDTETVVANGSGIEFQTFSTMALASCALPFTLTNATSASVVAGTTCADTSRGQWTFQAGTATLDVTGCVMTVSTSGTVVDPGMGAGTFTTSATLDLQ